MAAIFVTGAGGFVGTAIVDELLRRNREVVALSHARRLDRPGVREVRADILDRMILTDAMRGCGAVIHLIGIIAERPGKQVTFERMHVEATRAVIEAAANAGLTRYLHMSALGSRPNAASEYHKTKWRAEKCVRASRLAWTIFRPSLIHGPHGEFMTMEARWARGKRAPFLFMPYFGKGLLGTSGSGKLQPVYVNDVARAFVDALENTITIDEEYALCGPEQMTWAEMHHRASKIIVGRERLALGIPAWYAKLLARVLPRRLLPFNWDQVVMSLEDNVCAMEKFQRDFGWKPAGFDEAVRAYAAELP